MYVPLSPSLASVRRGAFPYPVPLLSATASVPLRREFPNALLGAEVPNPSSLHIVRLIPISAFAFLGGGDCPVVRRLPWGVWVGGCDMRRLRGRVRVPYRASNAALRRSGWVDGRHGSSSRFGNQFDPLATTS